MNKVYERKQVKKYVEAALACPDNIVVHYATGRNSSYTNKNTVVNRIWILTMPHLNLEYEIFLDNHSIIVSKIIIKRGLKNNTSSYRRYGWTDMKSLFEGLHVHIPATPLTEQFNTLYNRALGIVEDIMGVPIEEFTQGKYTYLPDMVSN